MKTRWFGAGTGFTVLVLSFGSLALLLAQNTPRFTRLLILTNKEAALTLNVSNGAPHRIDAASDASAWAALVTLPGAGTSLQHTDTAAPYSGQRFYRAEQLSGTNLLTGDHLATTNGDVIIHPLNHASLILSWQGKTIYNDAVNAAGPFTGFSKADLILVSHEHSDHFSSATIESVRRTNAIIICPQVVYNSLSAIQKTLAIVLANGATTNILGLTVEAVPVYNFPTNQTIYHAKGNGNGYVLTIGGKRLYMCGDTQDVPEMRALPDIDAAFICMNLPFTMTVDAAASAVRQFRPRVVYPYHYSSSDVNRFKRLVGSDLGIEVRLRKWY